jgi:acyl carrier protein phosphodiesterase
MQTLEHNMSAYEKMAEIRADIKSVTTRRDRLKAAMEAWYDNRPGTRFPQMVELFLLDERLSSLDSRFKQLWDQQQAQQQQ